MADQGKFRYPGITGVLSASYTMRRGISPAMAQVEIAYDFSSPPTIQPRGTMQWIYGTQTHIFPNCAVESVQVTRPGGATIWRVSIADRRWAWRFGAISGEYNLREGSAVIPSREKTPQELATLLLQAMGEPSFNVTQLPNDTRPYVDWQLANPAKELASLCDSLGCVVVLRLDNTVKIERIGQGADLPLGYLAGDTEFDPSIAPRQLAFYAAPTQWQVDLPLEAVGKDTDETFKPIADLSYAPVGGWGPLAPGFFSQITDPDERKLARDTVWRCYRVNLEDTLSLPFMDETLDITDRKRVLPLVAEQVETEGTGEESKPKEPIIWGRFNDLNGTGIPNVASVGTDTPESVPELEYPESFQIDIETGIVTFSDPVYTSEELADTTKTFAAAELYLRCSVNLKEEETRAFYRVFKVIDGDPTSFSKPQIIVKPDTVHQLYYDYDEDEWVDNLTDVEEAANYYLTEAIRDYVAQRTASAIYAGFPRIELDGSRASVTFTIDGNGHAKTSASLNIERYTNAPSYKERREREELKEALVERDRQKREQKRRGRR